MRWRSLECRAMLFHSTCLAAQRIRANIAGIVSHIMQAIYLAWESPLPVFTWHAVMVCVVLCILIYDMMTCHQHGVCVVRIAYCSILAWICYVGWLGSERHSNIIVGGTLVRGASGVRRRDRSYLSGHTAAEWWARCDCMRSNVIV